MMFFQTSSRFYLNYDLKHAIFGVLQGLWFRDGMLSLCIGTKNQSMITTNKMGIKYRILFQSFLIFVFKKDRSKDIEMNNSWMKIYKRLKWLMKSQAKCEEVKSSDDL